MICKFCRGLGRVWLYPLYDKEYNCLICGGSGEAKMCDICKINECDGTVGDLSDDKKTLYVCKECYYNKLNMKPLGYMGG